jgi:hypothetical protein
MLTVVVIFYLGLSLLVDAFVTYPNGFVVTLRA